MFKYTLIISQYIYSRHFFIVKHDENFIENARKFSLELMAHKRSEEHWKTDFFLGDLDPKYVGDGKRDRYNVNDAGDIYFIQSNYANYCMCESWSYRDDTRRESRGFQKKVDTERVNKHHRYDDVKAILNKYFEIA